MYCPVLYCPVLSIMYCPVLSVLYCLSCTVCNVMSCTVCNVLSCTVCNVLSCTVCNVMSCTVCNVLSCTVCNVLSYTVLSVMYCPVLLLYLIQSVLSDILDMAGKVEVDINLLTILKDFEICARWMSRGASWCDVVVRRVLGPCRLNHILITPLF